MVRLLLLPLLPTPAQIRGHKLQISWDWELGIHTCCRVQTAPTAASAGGDGGDCGRASGGKWRKGTGEAGDGREAGAGDGGECGRLSWGVRAAELGIECVSC